MWIYHGSQVNFWKNQQSDKKGIFQEEEFLKSRMSAITRNYILEAIKRDSEYKRSCKSKLHR